MKHLIALLFILPTLTYAQVKAESRQKVENKQQIKQIEQKTPPPLALFTEPKFPGGQVALDNFVTNHFKLSRKDRKKEVEGEIKVRFTIAADGTIKNAKVINGGMSEKLNKEALKVINSLPQWQPGTQNGKATDALYLYVIKVG